MSHDFHYTGEIEFSRGLLGAECSCSNPDGEGVGGVSWMETTVDELVALWWDHAIEAESINRTALAKVVDEARRGWTRMGSGNTEDLVSVIIAHLSTVPVERKVEVTDEMVERAAKALCRQEHPDRSFDEMLTPSVVLWRRFVGEARTALEAALEVAP